MTLLVPNEHVAFVVGQPARPTQFDAVVRQLPAFAGPGGEKDALQRSVYLPGDDPFLVWRKSVGRPVAKSHGGRTISRTNVGTVAFAAALARFREEQGPAI